MKRFYIILAALFGLSNVMTAQNTNYVQTVESINNKLFLIEEGRRYPINTDILTVQKKSPEQTLPSGIIPINNSFSSFVDIAVPDNIDIREYAELLKQSGSFSTVEFRSFGEFCITPNDTYYNRLWHIPAIGIDQAWDTTTGSPNIKVAIIDTGIDTEHPDLGSGSGTNWYSNINTSLGWDYTYNTSYTTPTYFHGTAMAGIIGAKTNNAKGVAGVSGGNHSCGITMISYCISNDSLVSNTTYLRDAILLAVSQGARVINLSLHCGSNTDLVNAIQYAYNQGVTVVCATGNQSNSTIPFPANHTNTIAVGATGINGQRYWKSNYGTGIDLTAPGESIGTTILNNGYGEATGTSCSAAIISGTVALMLSVNPCLSPSEIRTILQNTCTKPSSYTYNANGWNAEVGYGIVDVAAAIENAKLEITGPTIPCGEEQYYVANLSNDYHTVWSWEYPSNDNFNITQDPFSNSCTLLNNNRKYVKNVLVASIYNGSELVATLRKLINTGANFVGTYSQDSITYNGIFYPGLPSTPFCSGDTLLIYEEGSVTLYSTSFIGATFSYEDHIPVGRTNDQNGTITFKFLHKPTPGPGPALRNFDSFTPHYQFNTVSTMTGKHSNDCESFRIHFNIRPAPQSNISNINLEIASDGNSYTFSLKPSTGETITSLEKITSRNGWILEIANLTTGENTVSKQITKPTVTLNTSGWKEGTYVVRALVADKSFTKKIVLNSHF